MKLPGTLTRLLAGALISVVTTGLLVGALEAVFPRLVPSLPLSLHPFLRPAVSWLAESSKSRTVPRAYIALLGDSYAQGEGDWHLTASGRSNPPYHSAHLLYQAKLGDVLSFGTAGAGSLEGIVGAPVGAMEYLDALRRFEPLGPPRTALIYFYEGNDLNNNLRDLRTRFLPRFDAGRMFDEAYFQRFIETVVVGESPLAVQAKTMTWRHRLLLPHFVAAALQGLPRGPVDGDGLSTSENGPVHVPAGRAVNRARVGNTLVELPDRLQGPALELTDEEFPPSLWVFQQATVFIKRRFPTTDFVIVYLPSPLSCYALEGDSVSAQSYEDRGSVFPTPMVRRNSDRVAGELRQFAETVGLRFIDARPELRAAAAERFIHGPQDWKHFNRLGYEALARAIVAGLKSIPRAR